MTKNNSTAAIIARTYLLGALVLLVFYGAIFYNFALYTEDRSSEKRLVVMSEFYSQKYREMAFERKDIDPLLTIYSSYAALPPPLQKEISPNWVGGTTFFIDDDQEFNVLAKKVITASGEKTAYFVENITRIELEEVDFIMLQIVIIGGGLLLFIISCTYIIKSAKQISEPVSQLSHQLEQDEQESLPLSVDGRLSDELAQMLAAINLYRAKISDAFKREQSFTRYISHELRTPMTVIKGSLSILRKSKELKTLKHASLIEASVIEMEQLTQTFLELAREEISAQSSQIDQKYLDNIEYNFSELLAANNVALDVNLLSPFELQAHPLLVGAIINNLLKNAINCSLNGQVSLFLSSTELSVVDNGVGLSAKPRGYEGFGIGLKIVQDICSKYGWQFELKNNIGKGCTASVRF